MATLTMIGTFLTLADFICQNLGIRQLHWSAGVAQLVSTLLLVFLRALLRRHVGERPENPIKLADELEASHLVHYMHQIKRFMIPVGVYNLKCHVRNHKLCDECRSDIVNTNLDFLSSGTLEAKDSICEHTLEAFVMPR